MGFSLSEVFLIGILYLAFFFLVAYITELGHVPARIVRHPATYVLSLGVYASAWAVYGSVGFAYDQGYSFLAYYLGLAGAFMLAPVILAPILRLTRSFQLASLADVFAFRYRSPLVGAVVTLCMFVSVIPLLALQIQAVADSARVLNQDAQPDTLAFFFCLLIVLFAILFGARHISLREKHEGLVVAMAFESVVKLVAIVALGLYVSWGVMDGPPGINRWLQEHPEALERLYTPLKEGPWRSLIGAFFVAAVVMPHMFHMAFTENLNPRALITASWGVPLYLLLLAVFVPIIVWGAQKLQLSVVDPDYLTLNIALQEGRFWLAILIFMAGLSAASGVIIVCTLALSAMFLNHFVLPLAPAHARRNLYGFILWTRRALIAIIILSAYAFYSGVAHRNSLSALGFLSFVATMQFVPGLVGVLLWTKANRKGFLAGLTAGFGVWFFVLLLPLLFGFRIELNIPLLLNDSFPTAANSYMVASFAIFLNSVVFAAVSLSNETSPEEQQAASACNVDTLRKPMRWELPVKTVQEFIQRLSGPLGPTTAEREVRLALNDLEMDENEIRPYALRRLRDQLESNLSGLLGPSVAHDIIEEALPYEIRAEDSSLRDIHFMESRLEDYQHRLTGLAAEVDSLRRFHRQTLQDMPVGVCSLGRDGEVVGWNRAMEALSGVDAQQVLGSNIAAVPSPWGDLLGGFLAADNMTIQPQVELGGRLRSLSCSKALVQGEAGSGRDGSRDGGMDSGWVLVLEDTTEIRQLEQKLAHSERLASIGRLAAGVAHEIGNPVTGIACLAQNLRYETQDDEVKWNTDQIIEQTKRISRIVQSLVNFAHGGHQHAILEPVRLTDCVQEAIDLLKLDKERREYTFVNDCPADLYVSGDHQKLIQVFVNLLGNARDASEPEYPLIVRAENAEQMATVHVEDHGSGIPPELVERIFEPFVTTKEPGKGTGLGMSVVYSIIEEHYGQIKITSPIHEDRTGTRITLLLPRFLPAVTPVTSDSGSHADAAAAPSARRSASADVNHIADRQDPKGTPS
jgi:Na+/proline symporter/signal transduction histidine kinase